MTAGEFFGYLPGWLAGVYLAACKIRDIWEDRQEDRRGGW